MERQFIPEKILGYCDRNGSPLGPIPEAILATADHLSQGHMMVGRHVGRLLQFLVIARQPAEVLEIGTFHGFSASVIAEALPNLARLTCCERDPTVGCIASVNLASYIGRGVLKLILRDGIAYLRETESRFDLIFIDADKASFCREIDLLHDRLNPNGILIVDNALAGLAAMDPDPKQQWERDTRQFNAALSADPRFMVTQLPLRDGVTLAAKR